MRISTRQILTVFISLGLSLGTISTHADESVKEKKATDMTVAELNTAQTVGFLVNQAASQDDPYSFLVAGRLAAEMSTAKFSVTVDGTTTKMSAADMLNQAKTLAGNSSPVALEANKSLAEIAETSGEQYYCWTEWACNRWGYCVWQTVCY